jgi:PAS domain S-box-containing protein
MRESVSPTHYVESLSLFGVCVVTSDLNQQLAKLKQGDHICLIYENAAQQLAAVVTFIIEGLARGERCVCITDDLKIDEVIQALKAASVDVVQERQRDALRLLTQDTYLRAREFVPQMMINMIRDLETEALADGFSGLRLTGEPDWPFGPEPGCDRLIEYEAILTLMPTNSRSVLLCQYHQSLFGLSCIHDVLQAHPVAILGDQVCPNPYYESPKLEMMKDHSGMTPQLKEKQVDWWIAQLRRASTAEQERERALEMLKQSERRLAEAQQVARIGSWERDLRTNDVYWSDELYRLFGLQPHEGSFFYQQFLNHVSLQDVDRIRALTDEAIRERGSFNCDYRITLSDGSVHVVNDRGSVILNDEGEPVRLVGTAQDVTELRQSETELKRQEVILQTIFDHIPMMVNFVDSAGQIQMVNKHCERVLGWSMEDAQARDLVPECYPDPEYRSRVMEYIRHPTPGLKELKIRTRDGRMIETFWLVTCLPDGTRIWFGQDITERNRVEKELREYSDSVQALSHRLLEVQEEECRHLARELHDEFGQVLATITLHLHAARGLAGAAAQPRLDECAVLLRQAGDQVRNLALELRPATLDTLGLEAALRGLAQQHRKQTGADVQVVGHVSGMPLSPEMMTACFRVVQEALTNVVRHAAARQVWIELRQNESALEVVVRDDGRGFDKSTVQEQATRRGRLGLLGMRERVEILGGSLEVDSQPELGTRIRASFPSPEAA